MDDIPSFKMNPSLDRKRLRRTFLKTGRIQVGNFLNPSSAALLYRQLHGFVHWRSIVVAEERLRELVPAVACRQSAEGGAQLLEVAQVGARKGFACVFAVNRLVQQAGKTEAIDDPVLRHFDEYVNDREFLDFAREVTGIEDIESSETQASRFQVGHFVSFHEGTYSADLLGTRLMSFSLSLTPEWKPEWGGMLEFRSRDGSSIEAYPPRFNALTLYRFPQGNWISAVTAMAEGPRYAISGALRSGYTSAVKDTRSQS